MTDSYIFRGLVLSPAMREALDLYASSHHPVGDFLTAVLSNDLRDAVARADHINLPNLGAVVAYCYNELPAACWGSPQKVANWTRVYKSSGDVEDA